VRRNLSTLSSYINANSCHGKITPGWALPEETPAEIAGSMYKGVQDCFDEVIAPSMKRRRPDSISHELVTSLLDGMEDLKV